MCENVYLEQDWKPDYNACKAQVKKVTPVGGWVNSMTASLQQSSSNRCSVALQARLTGSLRLIGAATTCSTSVKSSSIFFQCPLGNQQFDQWLTVQSTFLSMQHDTQSQTVFMRHVYVIQTIFESHITWRMFKENNCLERINRSCWYILTHGTWPTDFCAAWREPPLAPIPYTICQNFKTSKASGKYCRCVPVPGRLGVAVQGMIICLDKPCCFPY